MSDPLYITIREIHQYWAPKLYLDGKHRCYKCRRTWVRLERAHIKARHRGGLDVVENLHLLCNPCHYASELIDGEQYWSWLNDNDFEKNEQEDLKLARELLSFVNARYKTQTPLGAFHHVMHEFKKRQPLNEDEICMFRLNGIENNMWGKKRVKRKFTEEQLITIRNEQKKLTEHLKQMKEKQMKEDQERWNSNKHELTKHLDLNSL